MDTDKTKKLKEIATQYGLQLVILFGSQAKGVTHKESDVDIAYAGARPLDIDSEARLIVALAPIFGTDHIDLVDMHRASALILSGRHYHFSARYNTAWGKLHLVIEELLQT
ncbi:MAG: polymerase beta domain protein region protein [Parcubacteria group bacterium GW2011_GWA1_47_9]|nr:MAG: polymerase beta domain protein region protein [Parcubacteria group bacterium GW2011_GWA1_47_9]